MSDRAKGVLAVLFTYMFWGAMPIYWKAAAAASPAEILGHRAVWSCAFAFALLALTRGMKTVASLFRDNRSSLPTLALASAALTANWYLYIWAVNNGRILETSLGYFICPLISILFGVVVFRERLWPFQVLAVGIAACGVGVEVAVLGSLPLVALGIALSFACYGLLKKMVRVDALSGFALETLFIVPFALAWLAWLQKTGAAHYPYGTALNVLLAGAGVLTALPLLTFAWGLKRTPMTLVGLSQYASPGLSFLTATLLYHEPMPSARVVSFSLIWTAILLFTAESFLRAKRRPAE
ncbi:MAG: EamA family transporter RarD [Synergistaceae bacterium]|nr:EamA family transporter RarD [Synergistaceae bacterium]